MTRRHAKASLLGQASVVSDYYSKQAVRRSLVHFGFGKAAGAVVGLLTLLLIVRVLPVEDYGLYVALVGYLEIFNVVSSFGLAAMSEKLIPELRSRGDEVVLAAVIRRLVFLRVMAVGLASLLAVSVVLLLHGPMQLGGLTTVLLLFQMVVAFETVARFCETIFDSLLLQGLAQISLLCRTVVRLVLLAVVWQQGSHIALRDWLPYEAAAYGVGVVVSVFLLLRRVPRASPGATAGEGLRGHWGMAGNVYASQVIASLVGIDVVKIVVWKTAPSVEAAAFGFCASLAWMVQRYLPSYLLVGMVRPIIVAAVAAGAAGFDRLRHVLAILLKTNLLLMASFGVVLCAAGDPVGSLLSGGKFTETRELLLVMLLFVLSNSIRAVYAHVALAHGMGSTMLRAQIFGAAMLLAGMLLAHSRGEGAGYAAALVLMNVGWCATVLVRLRREGVVYPVGAPAMGRVAFVAAGMGVAMAALAAHFAMSDAWKALAVGGAGAVAFGLLAMALGLFSREEFNLVRSLASARAARGATTR